MALPDCIFHPLLTHRTPRMQAELFRYLLPKEPSTPDLPQEYPQPINIFCISFTASPESPFLNSSLALTVPALPDLSSISVNILPRLVIITPSYRSYSTCLIPDFSSPVVVPFLIDTCMHQLPISAIEGCMTVTKKNIPLQSTSSCQIHSCNHILNQSSAELPAYYWYRLHHSILPGFRLSPDCQ